MADFLRKMIENDKKELRRLEKIADKIDAHASAMEQPSDEQLRERADEFKVHYQKEEVLDELLPEVSTAVRRAAK